MNPPTSFIDESPLPTHPLPAPVPSPVLSPSLGLARCSQIVLHPSDTCRGLSRRALGEPASGGQTTVRGSALSPVQACGGALVGCSCGPAVGEDGERGWAGSHVMRDLAPGGMVVCQEDTCRVDSASSGRELGAEAGAGDRDPRPAGRDEAGAGASWGPLPHASPGVR